MLSVRHVVNSHCNDLDRTRLLTSVKLMWEIQRLRGSGVFAPLIRPPDFAWGTTGLHDGMLICGTESRMEAR